jgi:branched-chain amino acid aminotransferase
MKASSDPSKWLPKTSALQLQKPDVAFFAGEVRPWDEAVLHISSEAVLRGLNVFEGLKGYWQHDGEFALRSLRRHYGRLERSARLLHIPVPVRYEEFESACFEITRALYRPDNDLYIRATLFVIAGHWGEGSVADLVLTAYQQDSDPPDPVEVGVSTWRRPVDVAMPSRIKTSTNYQVARLARIEGRSRGYEDMILLNQADRVAEATAACVLLVRDGAVFSPPAYEGALESITVQMVADLCASLDIEFSRRPIERSELHIADELGLAGTLCEVTHVRSIDGMELSEAQVLSAIERRYRGAVRGSEPHPRVKLDALPHR